MARASANRGKRPRPNARPGQQRVARPAAAPPRRSYEDQLFFTRLRRHMKWVFILLAVAFVLGFVVYGVGTGTGGGNVGDVLKDIIGKGSGGPSVAEAQKQADAHPDEPQAWLDLSTALQTDGKVEEAAAALERYLKLEPTDADVMHQLAALYQVSADTSRNLASNLRFLSVGGTFSSALFSFPGDSGFMGALGNDPVDQALQGRIGGRASEAIEEASGFYAQEQAVLERLAKLTPDDPEVLLQLGQAADGAGDSTAAIAAFTKFLLLAPDDSRAKDVENLLRQLGGATPDVVTG